MLAQAVLINTHEIFSVMDEEWKIMDVRKFFWHTDLVIQFTPAFFPLNLDQIELPMTDLESTYHDNQIQ